MKLKKLSIRNFKGIRELDLDLGGESASIYGDNATGKTSVYDAFLWLLFGKDSRGAAAFSLKPLGRDGEPIHNVETGVEATVVFGAGSEMNLRRVYREVWTRRRGDVNDSFTGHESLFFVDGLPAAQGSFKKTVESIMPESLFRALTNPLYFPETMKWQDRRSQLFKLFGGLTDEEVAATDERYTKLLNLCGRHSVEEFSAATKVRIRNFNATLKELPARIDEAGRQVIEDDDEAEAEARVDALAQEIRDLRAALEAEDDQELLVQKVAVENEILQMQHRNDAYKEQMRLEDEVTEQLRALEIPSLEADARIAAREAAGLEQQLIQLRARFTEVASELYTEQDKCPTCGRPFTVEDLATAKAAWEAHRTARLDAINAEGRELSARHKAAKERASEASDELERRKAIAAEYEEALASLRTENLAPNLNGFVETMNQLTERRSSILEAIAAARAGSQQRNIRISKQMGDKQADYAGAKQRLAAVKASQMARVRIEELRAQQAQTVEALEDAEAIVALCEEFIRARVSLVEESINANFDLVRWHGAGELRCPTRRPGFLFGFLFFFIRQIQARILGLGCLHEVLKAEEGAVLPLQAIGIGEDFCFELFAGIGRSDAQAVHLSLDPVFLIPSQQFPPEILFSLLSTLLVFLDLLLHLFRRLSAKLLDSFLRGGQPGLQIIPLRRQCRHLPLGILHILAIDSKDPGRRLPFDSQGFQFFGFHCLPP